MITKQEALDYHANDRKGKIEVILTKPCKTQLDLSLAFGPDYIIPKPIDSRALVEESIAVAQAGTDLPKIMLRFT